MSFSNGKIDITKNIRIIESLKCDLLTEVSKLFKTLSDEHHENVKKGIEESLSDIILLCYILGRRTGLNYSQIETRMKRKLRLGLLQENDLENSYNDISELAKIIVNR